MIRFRKIYILLLILPLLMVFSNVSLAQLSAVTSSHSTNTNYPNSSQTDIIYVFCTSQNNPTNGEFTAKIEWDGTTTFLWEKLNRTSLSYEMYQQESTDQKESVISNLDDGLYRVTISQGDKTKIHKAWVINSWFENIEATISGETCESFRLNGNFNARELNYFDPSNGENISLEANNRAEWRIGNDLIIDQLNATIYNLPTNDTKYTLHVLNDFGCDMSKSVMYESLVPKAEFSVSPASGEAPLVVDFNNQSINATPGLFEWRLFRDLNEIKRESERNPGAAIDSFFIQPILNDEFQFAYENTGIYNVKLIARKQTGDLICADTTYLEDLIVVDSSFVDAPNFFSPNGDGVNDDFVVAFHSMKDIKISIMNRWGKKVHYWEKSNIQGFENSYAESVWDGKVNNRYASPGVYYYIVKGRGRDGERRRTKGFLHLFRDR